MNYPLRQLSRVTDCFSAAELTTTMKNNLWNVERKTARWSLKTVQTLFLTVCYSIYCMLTYKTTAVKQKQLRFFIMSSFISWQQNGLVGTEQLQQRWLLIVRLLVQSLFSCFLCTCWSVTEQNTEIYCVFFLLHFLSDAKKMKTCLTTSSEVDCAVINKTTQMETVRAIIGSNIFIYTFFLLQTYKILRNKTVN